MTQDPNALPLRCRCGHVRGVANEVAPHSGFRFVCYCQDCQAFARFLEQPDVLDTAGGTDIFHLPASRVKLKTGTDAVRCLHLSSKVFRWYTDCCRTPIGNTAGPRFPVIGLIHSFMSLDTDGRTRDEMLGAPLCRIFRRMRLRRARSASLPSAYQRFSAGGCAGSVGLTRSSTIIPTLHSPCRAY
jgi:hypothetical protein